MISICVSSTILGTQKHLVCNIDGTFSWVTVPPGDTLFFTGEIKDKNCFDTLLKLGCKEINVLPDEKFIKSIRSLTKRENIPWQKTMPFKTHRDFTKRIVSDIMDAMDKLPVKYLETTWEHGNDVLSSLGDIYVDTDKYGEIIRSGEGNRSALKSFKPDIDGLVQRPTYDRFGARTGRMTISSGADILTLKKEHRKMLKSRFGDEGSIVSLDFAALEVRICLYEAGNSFDDNDLYESIVNNVFNGTISRNLVKKAMISELYGQKEKTLKKTLGISDDKFHEFSRKLKDLFKRQTLLDRIKNDFIENGSFIHNKHGRCIMIDEPLDKIFVNSYAQATGVDVVLLGFKQIIDAVKCDDIVPIAMIHDAMLFDCKNVMLDVLKSCDKVVVDGYKQSFIVKFEQV